MKKLLFSFVALCMGMCAMAQSTIYVYQKDGNTCEIAVSNLDSISFTKPTTGTENGYTWVDLGLPSGLRWATTNVGATNPEDYGNYYAWGETTTKSDYSWDTYKYGSRYNVLTKYCNDANYGKDSFTDTLTTLELADDAATANWGGNWRMPTITEWQELRENCSWIWTDDYNNTGVAGDIVKSKNGNSIFLPAAGYYFGKDLINANKYGLYWSSSLRTDGPHGAQYVEFYTYMNSLENMIRICGLSVRAVVK
jgi:hypothetical protein